jgi:phosphomannomutase
MTELLDKAKAWLSQDPDPVTRAELELVIQNEDLAELESRFGSRLEFGTAGLRGELGAGSNRMNRVLVAQAAAGLGRYLLTKETHPSAVIGFDGRVNSDIFAKDSAEKISNKGICKYKKLPTMHVIITSMVVKHLMQNCLAG